MRQLRQLANPQIIPPLPVSLDVEDRLRELFQRWAYVESRFSVLQPAGESRAEILGHVYNVADRTAGALTLRSDFTSLVAKEAATVGQEIPRPLRRSYAGTAFRRPERSGNGRREIRQAGVELIGASGLLADAEIVKLAADGLATLGLHGARIHLGHVSFVRSLLRSSNLPENVETVVCDLLAQHDRATLSSVLQRQGVSKATQEALDQLPDLVGSEDVLERARRLTDDPEAQQALDTLENLFRFLEKIHLTTPVILDLTEVRDRSYYTGIRLEGFAPSSGFPILRGGRYDQLLGHYGPAEPAVGCAFEIDRIAPLSSVRKKDEQDTLLLQCRETDPSAAMNHADSLRAQGYRVAFDVVGFLETDLASYVAAHRIDQIANLETPPRGDLR